MEQPSPTEIAVRIAREAIPAPMLGNHRVPFTGGPERFAAYVDGAGTLAPAGAVAPGPYDYYCDAPGLIGFLDIYRDAATETLYVGYINVRPDFRRRGVAASRGRWCGRCSTRIRRPRNSSGDCSCTSACNASICGSIAKARCASPAGGASPTFRASTRTRTYIGNAVPCSPTTTNAATGDAPVVAITNTWLPGTRSALVPGATRTTGAFAGTTSRREPPA